MDEPESPDIALPANAQVDNENPALSGMIERMKRDHHRQTRASNIAPTALREIEGTGRYMLPAQNSYAAHKQLIGDASLNLGFSAQTQPAFDRALALAPPPLRPMLAIMRNALMSQFFAQHAYQHQIEYLSAISRFINTQLSKGLSIGSDGIGAQMLYKTLLKRQNTPLWRMPSVWLTPAERPQKWGLLPLQESPFSDDALQMPPPAPENTVSAVASFEMANMTPRDNKDPRQQEAEQAPSAADDLNVIANEMASAGALTMSVEELHEPTKREAIELAKDILNKLRVKLGQALVEHGLSQFDFNPLTILGELKHVVKAFEFHLHKVAGLDANIYDNPAVAAANNAVGKLSYLAKQETLKAALKQGDGQMAALVQADLSQLPKAWNPAANDTFTALFDDLESGLKTIIDRMNHLADKDTGAAFWLGFSAENSLSGDPSGKTNQPQKAMQDDNYFRQLNAQRTMRARQAAVRYTQNQQHKHGDHAPRPSASTVNMNQLVGGDLITSMRNAMKTSAGAGTVETGTKANMQNVIRQKEQAVRAQRQRITTEQIRRANDRSSKHGDEHHHTEHHHTEHHDAEHNEPLQPPPGKKKDHSHGI